MIQREARVASPHDAERHIAPRKRQDVVVRNWERPVLFLCVLAIMALGFIGGLNSLIALFPK